MSPADESRTMTGEPPQLSSLPNPWIAVPVLVATAVGWFIGRSVALLSCPSGDSGPDEFVWGLGGALVGFVGVLVVSVLVVRSLAEWAAMGQEAHDDRPRKSPGPPTC